LKLSLLNHQLDPVGKDFWLQFDVKNQEFYGLPMSTGDWQVALQCSDQNGTYYLETCMCKKLSL